MGYKEMDVANVKDGGTREFAFESSVSLAAAGSSDSILIPDDVQNVLVTAQAAGGASVVVYTTTDPIAVVKAGSAVTWLAWGAGSVTTATGATFHPVTALKIIQSGAGTSKLTVRCQ